MPITELVVLSLKQDEATGEAFTKTHWPALASLLDGKKGMKLRTVGLMLTSNKLDVSSVFQPVLVMGMCNIPLHSRPLQFYLALEMNQHFEKRVAYSCPVLLLKLQS